MNDHADTPDPLADWERELLDDGCEEFSVAHIRSDWATHQPFKPPTPLSTKIIVAITLAPPVALILSLMVWGVVAIWRAIL